MVELKQSLWKGEMGSLDTWLIFVLHGWSTLGPWFPPCTFFTDMMCICIKQAGLLSSYFAFFSLVKVKYRIKLTLCWLCVLCFFLPTTQIPNSCCPCHDMFSSSSSSFFFWESGVGIKNRPHSKVERDLPKGHLDHPHPPTIFIVSLMHPIYTWENPAGFGTRSHFQVQAQESFLYSILFLWSLLSREKGQNAVSRELYKRMGPQSIHDTSKHSILVRSKD